MKFYNATLANGLTIVGEERPSAVSVALGFFVRTGARDETQEVSGVSHFLEHMMFKGTAKRSALDITYALSAIGAQSNAFTSEENTVYYAAVLPEYFAEVFEIVSDMMRPALDTHEFETERKVILEEIALYQDRPSHVLFESALKQFFGEHGGGNAVLGSSESIAALTVEQMRDYFSERYSPSNIVLSVAGKFVWNEVLELAQKYCSHWTGPKVTRMYRPFQARPGSFELRRESLQMAHAMTLAPGPAADDPDRYNFQVLSCLLGDSSGSRAFWDLIDKGICDGASIDADEMDRIGMIYSYLSAEPERMDEAREILAKILATPMNFSEDDLMRAKTKLRTRFVLQGESSMRRLMAVGMDWIYRRAYSTLEEELAALAAVNRSSIEQALARFSLQPVTSYVLLPG